MSKRAITNERKKREKRKKNSDQVWLSIRAVVPIFLTMSAEGQRRGWWCV